MKPIGIVLLVIAIILVAAMIVLYFLGKKAQKKKEEQDEQMKAAGADSDNADHRQKTNENERCRPSFPGNGAGKQTHAARQTSNRKSQSRTKSHDTDRRRADLR